MRCAVLENFRKSDVFKIALPIITLCWMFLILWLGHQDKEISTQLSDTVAETMHAGYNVRIAAHVFLYGILGVLLECDRRLFNFPVSMAYIVPFVFAIIDEGSKFFVPGRHCDIPEVFLDGFSGVLGCLMVLVIWKIAVQKKVS